MKTMLLAAVSVVMFGCDDRTIRQGPSENKVYRMGSVNMRVWHDPEHKVICYAAYQTGVFCMPETQAESRQISHQH
jgi:hypothetical protein